MRRHPLTAKTRMTKNRDLLHAISALECSETGDYSEGVDDERIELNDPADNAQAVCAARRLASRANFDETDQFMIATAVSELATNIIRYAKHGEVTLRIIERESEIGFEIVAQDEGPGIIDLELAMKENVSSGNSLGLGLPSVKRIMDEFHIETQKGVGTMIIARKWRKACPTLTSTF